MLVYKLSVFVDHLGCDGGVLLVLCRLGLVDLAGSHLERGNFLFVHVARLRNTLLLGHVSALFLDELTGRRGIEGPGVGWGRTRDVGEDRAST